MRWRAVDRGLAGLTAVALGALWVAGCASAPVRYTGLEQARIDEYEQAAEQVLRSRSIEGPPPVVHIGSDPVLSSAGRPTGFYTDRVSFRDFGRPGSIFINRAAVADDYVAQAVLSQELAHYVLGLGPSRCRDRRHECEVEARIASVELLMTGWGLGYADAVRLQYAYLKSVVLAVERGEVPALADPSEPCRQLQEFADHFRISGTCE
jgi:hypothetical protein